ncbi:hypothetical protein ACQW5G_00995 [Fructilactobacillus sp. Tb1]|uniref:hypothetical protein n=1 Tax=Fructilactobacillus sp. Tb1 TaxID=3422304 RepID=UPI003D29672F
MYDENDQQNEKLTRSQFKEQSRKHHFGSTELNHFKDEIDDKIPGQPTVGSRSERDTEEFKQKRLGRRLNIAIGILIVLLILVLAIMRYVG